MDRNTNITPHFRWCEFIREVDRDPPGVVLDNLKALAKKLEEVRIKLGNRPITITSGYRTVIHNRAIGGAPKSQHLLGKAVDFNVSGLTAREVQYLLDPWWPGGMGYGSNFTHLDIRAQRVRFFYG